MTEVEIFRQRLKEIILTPPGSDRETLLQQLVSSEALKHLVDAEGQQFQKLQSLLGLDPAPLP